MAQLAQHKGNEMAHEVHPFSQRILDGEDGTLLTAIRRYSPNVVVYRARLRGSQGEHGFVPTPMEIFWFVAGLWDIFV